MNEVTQPKVTRSVALDKDVADRVAIAAREQNRSFSNYVETLLTQELAEPKEEGACGRRRERRMIWAV